MEAVAVILSAHCLAMMFRWLLCSKSPVLYGFWQMTLEPIGSLSCTRPNHVRIAPLGSQYGFSCYFRIFARLN